MAKRKHVEEEEGEAAQAENNVQNPAKKSKWTNKRRVLIFSCRGISYRARHLMTNLRTLLPHSKPDVKMEKKDPLYAINDICEMKNCNKCVYFEARRKKDLYMWVSDVPDGPSAKFLVENVHTMEELKLTGNCLQGSRALLSFDESFGTLPHLKLMKELFTQTFGTPYHHPKSQPFIDHVFTFAYVDNKIWFRCYQIVEEDGSLAEMGPRFVLNPICVLANSFGGSKLWSNPKFVSPNKHRRLLKAAASQKYLIRVEAKAAREVRTPKTSYELDPTDLVFETKPEPRPDVVVKKKNFKAKPAKKKNFKAKRQNNRKKAS